MTDREKLIELLESAESAVYWNSEDKGFLDKIADHLLANGVTFRKWIPVSERLPENGEIVLCRLIFNELRILQWDSVSKWWLGYGTGDDWRQTDVTHWMPLPEPPQEE